MKEIKIGDKINYDEHNFIKTGQIIRIDPINQLCPELGRRFVIGKHGRMSYDKTIYEFSAYNLRRARN